MHREQLGDVLWPELDAAAAAANLRKALYYARRALDSGDGVQVLGSDADLVWLPTNGLWLDIEAFRMAVAAGRRSRDPERYRSAVDLYRDGLLPEDRYEEWADGPREELRSEYLSALEEFARLLEAGGELDDAAAVARRLIASDPLREDSHATLIRLHALAGRRAEALQAYEQLRRLLDDELGVEPSAETQRLVAEVGARQAIEPELSADLWERVGDLRVISGDAAGAARAYATALDVGGSATPGRLERKCADAWLMRHRPDAAASHLAVAEVQPVAAGERSRLLRTRANLAWETGDLSAARTYAEQALAAAHQDGTADDLAAAHEALAIVSHCTGDWRHGLAAEFSRLTAEGDDSTGLARVFDIHHCIGQYHLYGDALSDSVESYARELLDRAEQAGAARAQAFAWCLLGESTLLQGRFDEAAGCLGRSCALYASVDTRSGALAWQRRAELAACRGVFDQTDGHLEQASSIATISAMASHLWGRIHATHAFAAVEQGDPDRAVRSVRAAAAAAARYGDCPSCSALLNPIAAEAFALLGDAASARVYADAAAHVATLFDSSAWRAMAESAAGSVAVADGDFDTAATSFDSAHTLYERARQPYWAERSLRLASVTTG